jgi:hypothetical protein
MEGAVDELRLVRCAIYLKNVVLGKLLDNNE